VIIFNITLIFHPAEIIGASKDGLSLWFNNILPSLLPFMIGVNILVALGSVKLIAKLLEPLMRLLFKVSGAGAFALICGMLCGYPMGAKIVSNLREKGEITKSEAQKLIGFTNNSGPIFILGTIGIGIFGSRSAGVFIISVHYLSAIITGLILRFYKSDQKPIYKKPITPTEKLNFSHIFSKNVISSMETLVQIGGFIILFSVLVKVFELLDISVFISNILSPFSERFSIVENVVQGTVYGVLEMSNGIRSISQGGISKHALIATCLVISFGGFSVHAQSINFISKTDIKTSLYIVCKFLHATIALALGLFMYPLFSF